MKTINNSVGSTKNRFYSGKSKNYSQVSNASLMDYKKKLQSQISSIKAADIFDTSTRYTVLNEPSSLFSSIITGSNSPDSRKKQTANSDYVCNFTKHRDKSRQKFRSGIYTHFKAILEAQKTPRFEPNQFSRVRSILLRKKVAKKLQKKRKAPTISVKSRTKNIKLKQGAYLNRKASKGFSMIKFKIDRVKNPMLYTQNFPELERLKEAAKINLKSKFPE